MVGTFTRSPVAEAAAQGPGGNLGRANKSEIEGSSMSNNACIDRGIFRALKIGRGANCLARLAKRANHARIHYFSPHRLPAVL